MKKYNLVKIIIYDFFCNNFLILFLFILVFFSAFFVLTITYRTRILIERENLLIKEKELLEIEYHRLLFRENFLRNTKTLYLEK